ncbi:MAG TPA: ABC transporter substrate-binding protein [Bacillota bacterium]|nr:ABC transporter substrate-binding protein [Bacillota bacterium]
MRKNKLIVLSLLLLGLLLVACSPEKAEQSSEINTEANSPGETGLPTTDPAGNPITVPDSIERIVSLAPSTTEILIEMGYGDRLVAVDTQSKNIEALPANLVYLDLMSPDIEKLIEMKPDIIYASTMSAIGGVDMLSPLTEFGISVVYIPSSESIERIYQDIEFIAATLKDEEVGDRIIREMKSKIEEIRSIGGKVKDKKSVYFEIGAAPYIYSFGTGVFLNEMIEIIGAENALADQAGWISVSEEVILSKNPDVILTNVNYIEDPVQEIKSRSGWDAIKAVKEDRVYYIDNMASSLPNHNIVKALEEMIAAVYPERD